jgi:hypothetical protein
MTIFDEEMENLEKQQRMLRNQYEEENQEFNDYEYVRKLRQATNLSYAIGRNEKLSNYAIRLRVEVDQAAKKNNRTHVWNNGRGAWFTHKDKFGIGCFMCEDVNLNHYMMSIIEYFAHKYPDERVQV